jgi:hypothetical protein
MRLSASRAQTCNADAVHTHLLIDHAGVVDQAGQRAEFGIDARKHRQHLGFIGDVGRNHDRATTQLAHASCHRLRRKLITRVVDGDVPASFCTGDRRRRADAAAGAGDEDRAHGGRGRAHFFLLASRSNLRQ